MAKTARNKELELQPDAWERFERAVDVVSKSPPQHRTAKAGGKPKPPKKARSKR